MQPGVMTEHGATQVAEVHARGTEASRRDRAPMAAIPTAATRMGIPTAATCMGTQTAATRMATIPVEVIPLVAIR